MHRHFSNNKEISEYQSYLELKQKSCLAGVLSSAGLPVARFFEKGF